MSNSVTQEITVPAVPANLGDFTLAGNGTQTGDWITGLDAAISIEAQASLAVASGGGTAILTIFTSLDQGQTRIPIMRFDFATTPEAQTMTVRCDESRTTPLVIATSLGSAGAQDGIIGDRVQAEIVTAGTAYAGNSLLSVRAAIR